MTLGFLATLQHAPAALKLTNQYVSAGDATEPQVLHSSLLKLNISITELAV